MQNILGADFYKINPKGNVPAIILDDGTVLNENAATLQYIVDQSNKFSKNTKIGAPGLFFFIITILQPIMK